MKPKVNRASDPGRSMKFDRCGTPPYALDPLIPFLDKRKVIWECAAGDGLLAGSFRDRGFKVIASDILTGQNFLEWAPKETWASIVTNPPYSIKYKFLGRCYDLGKPFALLVPVEMLGAWSAQKYLKKFGCEILLLNRRVSFGMPNRGFEDGKWKSSAQFPTFWLCHKILPSPIMFGEIVK